VLPAVTRRVGQEIGRRLERLGLAAKASYRSSSYGSIREMPHGGDLLSIMPRLMMAGDLLRGASLPIVSPERPAGLIRPRDRVPPRHRAGLLGCASRLCRRMAERGLVAPARET
jgi:LysR family pca operon transcriptional activator